MPQTLQSNLLSEFADSFSVLPDSAGQPTPGKNYNLQNAEFEKANRFQLVVRGGGRGRDGLGGPERGADPAPGTPPQQTGHE